MSAQSTGSGSPLVSGAPVACPWQVPLLFSPEKACDVPIPRLFDSCSFHGEWAKWLLVMACFLCSLSAEQCEWPTWTVIVGAPSGCFSLCSILQVGGGLTESGSYKRSLLFNDPVITVLPSLIGLIVTWACDIVHLEGGFIDHPPASPHTVSTGRPRCWSQHPTRR